MEIDEIIGFCYKNQEYELPFNLEDLQNFIVDTCDGFFDEYSETIQADSYLLTVFENLKTLLNDVFNDEISLENLQKSADKLAISNRNYKQLEDQKIIEEFIIVTEKLPENWLAAQIFNGNERIYQFFAQEILSLRDEINSKARKMVICQFKDLIRTRLDGIRFEQGYLEIFREFIEQFYDQNFFSRINQKTQNFPVPISKPQEQINKEKILENPLDFVRNVSDMRGSEKHESVDFLCEIYPDLIEENFDEKIGSTLKDLLTNTIRETLK